MVMDRNKLITKLQNLTKSGRRPRTSPGLVGCVVKNIETHRHRARAVGCLLSKNSLESFALVAKSI